MLTNQFVLYFDFAFSCFCQTSPTSQLLLSVTNTAIAAFHCACMKEFSSGLGFSLGIFPSQAVPAVVLGSSRRIH